MLWRIVRRYASTNVKTFTYPQRITRSPTDLLQALNSCVQTDGSNPSYQYVDDPYLIPTSAYEKRQFALSKSSGKKAARWIIDRYPFAFHYDVAVPSIPSYFPSYAFEEREFIEPDENTLYKLMNWNQLIKAHEMYHKCLKDQVNVSDACQYALFDLLCIYNSENPTDNLPAEEHWYRRELSDNNQQNLIKRSWKDNGLAEQMFEQFKTTAQPEHKFRLYNSFLSGLLKYNHTEKAMSIIDEMKQNQIPLDLTSYNYLLRAASLIKETYDARWQFVVDHLKEMKENGIAPNLRTFHGVLYTLRRCSAFERGPTLALSVLKEMRQCGIEPSLGTWAHLIMIVYPNDQLGLETKVLPQILDQIEEQYRSNGNQLQWRDIDDGEFFFNAMFKATANCRDVEMAKRIHRFLMTGSNIRFISDGYKEQIYYTNLFRLLFRVDVPEHVMPIWESVVPNIYSPSVNVIEEYMEFVSTWNLKDHFPRLWSDLVTLGLLDNRQNNRRLVERYIALLNRVDQDPLNENQIKQYANIARQVLKRFPLVSEEELAAEEQQQSINNDDDQQRKNSSKQFQAVKFQYNGQLLSNLICLLSQSNDFDGSWTLFDFYSSNRNTMINPLSERCLMALLSLAVKENHIDRAFTLLQTINDFNYDCLADALDVVNRNLHLSHQDRQHLRSIQKNSSLESAHLVKLI